MQLNLPHRNALNMNHEPRTANRNIKDPDPIRSNPAFHCNPVRGMCTSLMNALMIFLCALSSYSMFLYSSLHIV